MQLLGNDFHKRDDRIGLRWVKIGGCNHKNNMLPKNLTHLATIWKHSRIKGKPIYCGQPECRARVDIIPKTNYHPAGDEIIRKFPKFHT